jgi:hypothetical protein
VGSLLLARPCRPQVESCPDHTPAPPLGGRNLIRSHPYNNTVHLRGNLHCSPTRPRQARGDEGHQRQSGLQKRIKCPLLLRRGLAGGGGDGSLGGGGGRNGLPSETEPAGLLSMPIPPPRVAPLPRSGLFPPPAGKTGLRGFPAQHSELRGGRWGPAGGSAVFA